MSANLLLTGASGHVGFKVLVLALEAGYRVRAAVRNQDKADAILATPSITSLSPGSNLSFTIVPDILAEGAYDEAVKGVTYVIHCASPIITGVPPEKFESDIIQPALKGTMGILESAAKQSQIRRIVITSSEVAVVPPVEFFVEETGKDYQDTGRIPFDSGPYANEFIAYGASKARALVASEEFIKTRKPSFDLINVMSSFVIGKNELVTDAKDILKGSNSAAFGQVLGRNGGATPSTSVFLDDVALVHVKALDPKVAGNQGFLVSSDGLEGTNWSDAKEIVARNFPKQVEEGVLPNNGSSITKKLRLDSSKTEETFGIKLQPYETQVLSVTRHYLELVGAKA